MKTLISLCITLVALSACATDDPTPELPLCTDLGAGKDQPLVCHADGVCVYENAECCVPCDSLRDCRAPSPRCEAVDADH